MDAGLVTNEAVTRASAQSIRATAPLTRPGGCSVSCDKEVPICRNRYAEHYRKLGLSEEEITFMTTPFTLHLEENAPLRRVEKRKISNRLRVAIWRRDHFTCQHCGTHDNLVVDHIVPESKGGTLEESNLQTLCNSCNSSKGAKHPHTPPSKDATND
jgi:5-methylcytosine-specific restriction endonuclease McrA